MVVDAYAPAADTACGPSTARQAGVDHHACSRGRIQRPPACGDRIGPGPGIARNGARLGTGLARDSRPPRCLRHERAEQAERGDGRRHRAGNGDGGRRGCRVFLDGRSALVPLVGDPPALLAAVAGVTALGGEDLAAVEECAAARLRAWAPWSRHGNRLRKARGLGQRVEQRPDHFPP